MSELTVFILYVSIWLDDNRRLEHYHTNNITCMHTAICFCNDASYTLCGKLINFHFQPRRLMSQRIRKCMPKRCLLWTLLTVWRWVSPLSDRYYWVGSVRPRGSSLYLCLNRALDVIFLDFWPHFSSRQKQPMASHIYLRLSRTDFLDILIKQQ